MERCTQIKNSLNTAYQTVNQWRILGEQKWGNLSERHSMNFKFIKTFLKKGSGPGETYGFLNGSRKIYCSKNGMIYFCSPSQKKIIEFNNKGEYVRDINIPLTLVKNFFPVVDKNHNYYTLSNSGAVDIFDKKQIKTTTLLDIKDYYRFLIFQPDISIVHKISYPNEMNTFYDVLPENGVIIFLINSSTVYIFKDNQLLKKFPIWPKKAMETYLLVINDMKSRNKKQSWFVPFAWNFFIDKDNENFFYIDLRYSLDKITLYKFNLKGELIKVLYKKGRGNFLAKKNNLFYGIDQGTIYIYKEE